MIKQTILLQLHQCYRIGRHLHTNYKPNIQIWPQKGSKWCKWLSHLFVCVYTDIVGHHDGEQRLVVWVEGDVQGGGLDHDEDGMKDWTTATKEINWLKYLQVLCWNLNIFKPQIQYLNKLIRRKYKLNIILVNGICHRLESYKHTSCLCCRFEQKDTDIKDSHKEVRDDAYAVSFPFSGLCGRPVESIQDVLTERGEKAVSHLLEKPQWRSKLYHFGRKPVFSQSASKNFVLHCFTIH